MNKYSHFLVLMLVVATPFGCKKKSEEEIIKASAKHYTDGQAIPDVGVAIGDIYELPNGRYFGDQKGECGIQYPNGAKAFFGEKITATNAVYLRKPTLQSR